MGVKKGFDSVIVLVFVFFVFIFYICILLVSLSFRDEIPLEMQTNQSLFVAIKKQVQA